MEGSGKGGNRDVSETPKNTPRNHEGAKNIKLPGNFSTQRGCNGLQRLLFSTNFHLVEIQPLGTTKDVPWGIKSSRSKQKEISARGPLTFVEKKFYLGRYIKIFLEGWPQLYQRHTNQIQRMNLD